MGQDLCTSCYVSQQIKEEYKDAWFCPNVIIKSVARLKTVVQELESTFEAAHNIILLRNRAKPEKLEKEISDIDSLLRTRKDEWSDMRLNDLEEMKAVKTEMIDSVNEMLVPTTAASQRKIRQAVKCQAVHLQEGNRFKRCWLGASASEELDSDDEEFVEKAIEEKATYHGRRHETVMYVNRRVKSETF